MSKYTKKEEMLKSIHFKIIFFPVIHLRFFLIALYLFVFHNYYIYTNKPLFPNYYSTPTKGLLSTKFWKSNAHL